MQETKTSQFNVTTEKKHTPQKHQVRPRNKTMCFFFPLYFCSEIFSFLQLCFQKKRKEKDYQKP